jgi:hypothetical protein
MEKICKRIKKLRYPEQSWSKVTMKVSKDLGLLKEIAERYYPNVDVLQILISYDDKTLLDSLELV